MQILFCGNLVLGLREQLSYACTFTSSKAQKSLRPSAALAATLRRLVLYYDEIDPRQKATKTQVLLPFTTHVAPMRVTAYQQ